MPNPRLRAVAEGCPTRQAIVCETACLLGLAGSTCLLQTDRPLRLARCLHPLLLDSPSCPDFRLSVAVSPATSPHGPGTTASVEETGFRFRRRGGVLGADHTFTNLELALDRPWGRPFTGAPWLMLALWAYLAHHDGAFIHGATCLLDGRVVLLLGDEEAGKTTLSRLISRHGGYRVSDENSFLRRQDGLLVAYGTPWPGFRRLLPASGGPPAAVCFLRHGTSNVLRPLSQQEATRRLLRCTRYFTWDPATIPATVDLLGQAAAVIPMFDYGFVPDATAVAALRSVL